MKETHHSLMGLGALKVLAVIPARGGSKGVPRKNVRVLCGKPLIAHTIETALAARRLFYRILVSTDDEEIAGIARQYGAEAPFLRPADLASDDAKSLPVVQHAVRFVEEQDGVRMDWICLLQVTAPYRTADDLDNVVRLAGQGDCDSVVSVTELPFHPAKIKRIKDGRLLPFCMEEREGTRRQDYAEQAYKRNGSVYMMRRDVLMEQGSLFGQSIRPYVMCKAASVDVDTELDLDLLEVIMRTRLQNGAHKNGNS